MNHARTGAALLVAMGALCFAACGSDEDDSGAETEITDAIEQTATAGDPSVCTEFQTQAFTEQTVGEGLMGEKAVKACEQNAKMGVAEGVEVGNVSVDGDTATAEAAMSGSTFDGQTLELALVEEDGRWKLDELTGFAEFDRDAVVASYTAEIEEFATPEVADCVREQYEGLTDAQVQESFIRSTPETVELVFGPCEELLR